MSQTPEQTDEKLAAILEEKSAMRREAYDRRNAQEGKASVSDSAVERFMALPEYQESKTIMWYIHCRSETRTKDKLVEEVNKKEKTIIVPYCTEDENGENKLGVMANGKPGRNGRRKMEHPRTASRPVGQS